MDDKRRTIDQHQNKPKTGFQKLPSQAGKSRQKNGMRGLGFGVGGLGFRVLGSGFRVPGSGFRVPGSGFGVPGPGFGV